MAHGLLPLLRGSASLREALFVFLRFLLDLLNRNTSQETRCRCLGHGAGGLSFHQNTPHDPPQRVGPQHTPRPAILKGVCSGGLPQALSHG